MKPAIIRFYSENNYDIEKFLSSFYEKDFILENKSYYEMDFDSPIQAIDILSCYSENEEKFDLNLWISLDQDIFILITEENINEIIKYIYERYPMD